MASNWIGGAYRGDAPFAHKIAIRSVTPANSGAMFLVVREDSSLHLVRDMVGKRVAIGLKGSGMVQHTHTILAYWVFRSMTSRRSTIRSKMVERRLKQARSTDSGNALTPIR